MKKQKAGAQTPALQAHRASGAPGEVDQAFALVHLTSLHHREQPSNTPRSCIGVDIAAGRTAGRRAAPALREARWCARDFAGIMCRSIPASAWGRLWLRVLVVSCPCGVDQITIAASIRAGRQLPVQQLAGVESDR